MPAGTAAQSSSRLCSVASGSHSARRTPGTTNRACDIGLIEWITGSHVAFSAGLARRQLCRESSSSWLPPPPRPPPPPGTRARTVRPALLPGRGTHWLDRGRLVGHRTGRCPAPCRRPVHPGRGEPPHWGGPVRIRAGLGDVGRGLGAAHRSATAMGRSSCAVHGTGRSSPGGVRLLGARGAQLGVAPRPAGVGDLDDRPRPSTAS